MWRRDWDKYDNHLQPTVCSPDPMSFPVKYGGKWRGDGWEQRVCGFHQRLRGHLRPEGPLRNAWLITKGVNYAGWGVQSHQWILASGQERRREEMFSTPSGYARRFITMILSRRVLPESQICFYVVQFKKNSSWLSNKASDSLVHFQGKKEKTSILTQVP